MYSVFHNSRNVIKKPSQKEELLIIDILKFGSGTRRRKIIEVMTDIYEDPANAYIETTKIFIFAQDKTEREGYL